MKTQTEEWDIVVKPKANLFQFGFKQVWDYRDLIFLFVKRDLVSSYKQTVLGPLWYFIQPIFTVIIYFFMFGKIAKISTGEIPNMLYYMGGLVTWNYFTDCLNITSNVFANNASLFGKVFFPRLIVPISSIFSSLLKFLIQMILFLCFWFYYKFSGTAPMLRIGTTIFLLPLLVLEIGLLGMSFGLILSALTTKYRDLRNLISYALQFGLYSSPIIFSLAWIKENIPIFYKICLINPMTGIIETFKSCFWPNDNINLYLVLYPPVFLLVIFFFSLITFNKVEKTFLDSV
ncbi:MAG TPA: ABC transporter permease [Bacteroidia bacterium]|jgi:lipopolysaccharide transport system permease protein|nr:ABC transporter permease [Bacteroidia bacterium]